MLNRDEAHGLLKRALVEFAPEWDSMGPVSEVTLAGSRQLAVRNRHLRCDAPTSPERDREGSRPPYRPRLSRERHLSSRHLVPGSASVRRPQYRSRAALSGRDRGRHARPLSLLLSAPPRGPLRVVDLISAPRSWATASGSAAIPEMTISAPPSFERFAAVPTWMTRIPAPGAVHVQHRVVADVKRGGRCGAHGPQGHGEDDGVRLSHPHLVRERQVREVSRSQRGAEELTQDAPGRPHGVRDHRERMPG